MPDDVRFEDLCKLLYEFRGDLREIIAKLEERHAFYEERYNAHTKQIAKLEDATDAAHKNIRALKEGHIKTTAITGLASGVFTALITALTIKFFLGGM